MFGLFKTGFKIATAQANLRSDFRLELNDVPDAISVRESFELLTGKGSFSAEACTAVLYLLVVRSYLEAAEQRRLDGKDIDPVDLIPLTNIYDRAIYWSEKAPDGIILELAVHSLNAEIEALFFVSGIRKPQ